MCICVFPVRRERAISGADCKIQRKQNTSTRLFFLKRGDVQMFLY